MENDYEFKMIEPTGSAMEKAESSRQMTEIQSQIAIAKTYPRDLNQVYTNLMKACSRKMLAEQAVYAYPRGGKTVSGPSIRLAEVAVQCFGNVDAGVRELEQNPGESTWQAYCYDLENNVKVTKTFAVKHERKAQGRIQKLTDPRDIYENGSNLASRRMRACILAVVPGDLIEAAVKQCKKTMLGQSDEPIEDRIQKMVKAFDSYQVSQEMIEQRLGHAASEMDMEELFEYRTIYESLKNGMAKRTDFFEFAKKQDAESSAAEVANIAEDEAEEIILQDAAPKEAVEKSEDKSEEIVEKPVDQPDKEAEQIPLGNPID